MNSELAMWDDDILANIDDEKRRRSGIFEISRRHYQLSVEPSWHYFSFFRLLQISPSYWLAHRNGDAPLPTGITRPDDFNLVLTTYEAFGPVWEIPFWEWWFDRAQYQFSAQQEPSVHLLGATKEKVRPDADALTELSQSVSDFFGNDISATGLPGTLLLAVPTHGAKKDVLAQVSALIDQHSEPTTFVQPNAKFKLLRNKLRKKSIDAAIRTVQARAEFYGKHPLHVVGHKAGISSSLDLRVEDKRRAVAMATSRHILHAHRLAENAARGQFPSMQSAPEGVYWPKFDYARLRELLARYAHASLEALNQIPEERRTSEALYAGRNRKLWPGSAPK